MSVRCVIARDVAGESLLQHSEHLFVTVPHEGESVSIMIAGKPEVFFVTGIMHCAAGVVGDGSDPIVNLSLSKKRGGATR